MGSAFLINPTAMEAGFQTAARLRGRVAASDAFSKTGLPHRRMEAWKWTDLRAALGEEIAPLTHDPDFSPSPFVSSGAFAIEFLNAEPCFAGDAPEGVRVSIVEDAGGPAPFLSDHPLANLAASLADRTVHLEVRAGARCAVLLNFAAAGAASHARVHIDVAEGASLTLLESHEGQGDHFANTLIEASVDAGASLSRFVVQKDSGAGVHASLFGARLGPRARFRQTALALGARLARIETRLAVEGAGADIGFSSAALLSGARHADVTSHVAHLAPGCRTRQIHRAALRGRSRGVFQGKFLVARPAQKTDAAMQARALLLSDSAEAKHKPELEIYADDVLCAHGATAGALDAEAMFYLRQRGLDETAARGLLIEAFVGEAFDGLADAGVEAAFRRAVRSWVEEMQ